MKKALVFLLLLPLIWTASAGAEGFDAAPYALEGPFIVDAVPLDAENLAAWCWAHETGAVDEPLYLAWWRGGKLYRQIEYAWTDGQRALVPCGGDACRVLTFDEDGGHLSMPEGYYSPATSRVTLYDWTDDGLTNPRTLTAGVIDHRETVNGVALLRQEDGKTWLSLYDGQGTQEADVEMAEGVNSVIRAARDQFGLWVVTVDVRQTNNDYRPLVIREGRVIWQGETGGLAYGAQMDGQGGYFVVERLSSNQYAPLTVTRYDGQARRLWRRELGGKNVVLSALPRVDPATGHLVILGVATANSRNLRRVYRLEADENLKTLHLDVRDCPAGEDVLVTPYLSPDCREARVLIRRVDGTPAAWAPFEALPAAENPNIKLK